MFGDDDENEKIIANDEGGNLHRDVELAERPENAGVLSFHIGTEEALLLHVQRALNKTSSNEPSLVLSAIDDFCYSRHWMMHIGDMKGRFLDSALSKAQSLCDNEVIVEIGSYCGYSAIRIASQLRPGGKLYCIEYSDKCVQWTTRMLTLAKMMEKVEILHGTVAEIIPALKLKCERIDLLFIDHDKRMYLTDLISIEQSGLLKSKAVVVADNVLSFGRPMTDYLDHVRSPAGPYVYSELYHGSVEYTVSDIDVPTGDPMEDGVEVSIYG